MRHTEVNVKRNKIRISLHCVIGPQSQECARWESMFVPRARCRRQLEGFHFSDSNLPQESKSLAKGLFYLCYLPSILCSILSGCAFTALFQLMSNHTSELGHLTVYKIPDFQLLMFRSSYIKHVRRQSLLDFPHASRSLW